MARPLLRFALVLRCALALLAAVVLGAWCIADVWPFFSDDAFISLRYADRLVAGNGLTWTDGERVEGYSNLAWVLACASFGAAGVSTTTAARGLGFACMLAVLVILVVRFRRSPGAGIAAVLAASTAFAPWTIGGLELPLLLLCVTAGLVAWERLLANEPSPRAAIACGAWFAVAALTRPDAPLFAAVLAAVAFATWWHRRGVGPALRMTTWFVLPIAIALAGQLVFRVAYYGDWLANTARIKVGSHPGQLADGLEYVGGALLGMSALSLLAIAGGVVAWRDRSHRAFVVALAMCAGAWAAYIARVGGDFFPAFRLVVPLLPAMALLAGLGIENGAAASDGRRRTITIVCVIAAIAAARVQTLLHPTTTRTAGERWEHDGIVVGETLRTAFASRDPLIAVDAAGAVPWASGLRSLDMFGLCDATIARDPSRAQATSVFARAHWRGSPDYLLGRAPDAFLFGPAPGVLVPLDTAGQALVDDPRFVAAYRCIWLLARESMPTSARTNANEPMADVPLWLRVDGRCGVQRHSRENGTANATDIEIPAWLLGAARMRPGFRLQPPNDPAARAPWQRDLAAMLPWLEQSAVAMLHDGALWLHLRRAGEYRCGGLRLGAGRYALTASPAVNGITLELRDAADQPLPTIDGRWVVAADAGELTVVLTVPPAAVPARLRTLHGRNDAATGR
jgi:arabinofuranosyltransferase